MKKQIKVSQVLAEVLIICVIFLSAFYSDDDTKQIVNAIAFLVAFFASLYMHRFFFPFILLSVTCYLAASTQELFSNSYTYLPITKFLWAVGNIALPIGILHFIYKLIFKFKITERDD